MSLHPECLAQLKLRQAPFEATPGEEFVYSDPLLESLIETAGRALESPGAIVLLAGAEGSGRSMQLSHLLGVVPERFDLIAFRARPNTPFEAVEFTIRSHLVAAGVRSADRPLTALLADRVRAGVDPILAIDDAHLFGVEIIDQLLRLRNEVLESEGRGPRLILVGDPELNRRRLPLPDPADEYQVVRLNLRPLNLEQTGAYLRHRLRAAGMEDPETFLTAGDVAALQSSSKGLPGALNANANAWLVRRCRAADGLKQATIGKLGTLIGGRESVPSKAQIVNVASGPATADVASPRRSDDAGQAGHALGVAQPVPQLVDFLVEEDVRADARATAEVLQAIVNKQRPLRTPGQAERARERFGLASARGAEGVSQGRRHAEVGPVGGTVQVPYWNRRWFIPVLLGTVLIMIIVPLVWQLRGPAPRDHQGLLEQGVILESSPPDSPAASREPSPPRIPEEPQPLSSMMPGTSPPSPEMAADSGQETRTGPIVTELDAPPTEPKPAPELEPGPEPKPGPRPDTASLAAPDPVSGQTWLVQQEPGHFTIQLIAARTITEAQAYVERHRIREVHYVQTRNFVVALVGGFPDRAAAGQALRELPAKVRADGPWIRSVGSVLDSQR